MTWLSDLTKIAGDGVARGVERRLLMGANYIEEGSFRWLVPTFREAPLRRARVEWHRWRYRRRTRLR